MPYVASTRHIDRVRNVIEGRTTRPDAHGKRLASSYRRSLEQYHLDPGASAGPRILTAPELRDIQHREESFLRASGQCLSRLHEMVREADYCVMLTDAQGVTIDYRVDRERRQDFKRAGLYLGSCWSESEEGTCGVASVLLDAEPITVHRTDHFRAAFTSLTCSAAPICGLSGELLGVLDASAVRSPDERDSQRLVNHIVRQSALLIEDAWFLNAASDCWVLLAHRNRHYVEAQPEILIAIDACGHAVAANRRARDCVPALNQLPRPLGELFDLPPERLFAARASRALVALRLNDSGSTLYARVRPPLVKQTPVRTSKRTKAAPRAASSADCGDRADTVAVAAAALAPRAPGAPGAAAAADSTDSNCAAASASAAACASASACATSAAGPNANANATALSERDALERRRIVAALSEAKWRAEQAAQALGMSRATLYRRIAKLRIVPPHKC